MKSSRTGPGPPGAPRFRNGGALLPVRLVRQAAYKIVNRGSIFGSLFTERGCLTIVGIDGGLAGTELVGELTAFADDVLRFYSRIRRDEVCFRRFEADPRVLPEIDATLAATAGRLIETASLPGLRRGFQAA